MALGDGAHGFGSPTVYSNDLIARAAYAAGIVDGEGWIGIKCHERDDLRTRAHKVYVTVANTDEKMVDFLGGNFGGSSDYKVRGGNRKPIYTWKTSSRNAVDFLIHILPYLITKREQALTAIRMQSTVSQSKHAHGIDDDTLSVRDECMAKMHVLNRRGGGDNGSR